MCNSGDLQRSSDDDDSENDDEVTVGVVKGDDSAADANDVDIGVENDDADDVAIGVEGMLTSGDMTRIIIGDNIPLTHGDSSDAGTK